VVSALSLVLFSLQAAPLPPLVTLEAPDVRVVHAMVQARRDLPQVAEDRAGVTMLARTATGLLVPPRASLTLPSLHAHWNVRADTAFLRQQWPNARAAFITTARDSLQEPGIWLTTLDAAIAISRALDDAPIDSLARDLYASAEARLARDTSLYGLAFGLYPDSLAGTLLTTIMPYVRAIWPIGNGLAALAHYKYHRDSTAFAILEAMTQRDSFAPPMFLLPLLRGLIGWETDAANQAAALEPHLPAAWSWLNVRNLPIGSTRVGATIRRDRNTYSIHLERQTAGPPLSMRIAPALPAGAKVRNVTVNERDVPVHVQTSAHDVHVIIELALLQEAQIDIEYESPRKRASVR
jgi:hypothetical protein